jgi:hypothetical protein
MMYERKQQMREKHLKVPPRWILRTIKRELNLFEHDGTLDDLHDEHVRLWHTGDRTVGNILLSGFGTNIILICYISLLSQGMSSRLGVRQGRSS